jgi:four helix bundle protein
MFEFPKRARAWVKKLRKSVSNIEDGKQLIRATGPVGANYHEANQSLSKKEFIMRIKICREEATELMNIFSEFLPRVSNVWSI